MLPSGLYTTTSYRLVKSLTLITFSTLVSKFGYFFSESRYLTVCCLTHSSGVSKMNFLRTSSKIANLFSLLLKRNEYFGKFNSCIRQKYYNLAIKYNFSAYPKSEALTKEKKMNEAEKIIADIKNRKLKPIDFLMGDEPYYIDLIADCIDKTVLTEDEKGFNQVVLYGRDTTVEDVVANAKRYPMMAEYQVVIVKEAQELSRNIDK